MRAACEGRAHALRPQNLRGKQQQRREEPANPTKLNPVKHGLARMPKDWAWSSFRQWVKAGEYEPDWCGRAELPGNVEYYEYET